MNNNIESAVLNSEKNLSIFSHLSIFVSFFIPLGNFIALFLLTTIWVRDSRFARAHAIEAANFQLTMNIMGVLGALLSIFIMLFTPFFFVLFFFLAFFFSSLIILCVIFAIRAAIKSSQGVLYRYPITIRFFK